MVTASCGCETNSRGDCETNSRGNFCTTGCWKVAMVVKYVQNGCQNFGYNFTLEICHTLWALGGNALKSVNLQWFFSTSIFLGWIFSLYITYINSFLNCFATAARVAIIGWTVLFTTKKCNVCCHYRSSQRHFNSLLRSGPNKCWPD